MSARGIQVRRRRSGIFVTTWSEKMRIKLRIGTKLTLGAMAGALAIVTVAGITAYQIARRGLEEEIASRLTSVAQSRAAHVETFLHQHKNVVEVAATSRVLRAGLRRLSSSDADKAAATQDLNARLTTFDEPDNSVREILLLDRHGRVVASTDPKGIGLDRSADAYFVGAQEETFIKDAYVSTTTKRAELVVSAPLFDRKRGDLLGVLVARVDVTEFNAICTNRTGLGKTGETYLINKYGFMITPSRFRKDTFLKLKVETGNARKCLACQAATKQRTSAEKRRHHAEVFVDYRGVRVLGVHAHIPEMEWGLLAEMDVSEAFAPVASLRKVLFVWGTLSAAAAVASAWVFARGITRPIRELTSSAERIGDGNFDHRVDIRSGDEVEQLAGEFNCMAAALAESYELLEQKVADRTAELPLKDAEMQKQMLELSRFNRLAVGRELKMAELKQEINDMLAELGRERKYETAGAGHAEVHT